MLTMLSSLLFANSPAVRIKDIASVLEVRPNQLIGFGLVVGLKNSGDSNQSEFTQKALTNLLTRLGIASREDIFKSRNIAAVMVTAELSPYLKTGQKIDATVSSLGDAGSLRGGTLVMTPLQGADNQVYAVCQGPVVISETVDPLTQKGKTETVGTVVGGALVEKEVPVEIGVDNKLTLVLRKPDFTTAARMAYSLERGGIFGSKAMDASTVVVPLTIDDKENIVAFVSKLEDFLVVPDSVAKVVVSQRTGTIVIGEDVKLSPCAIAYGDIEIKIKSSEEESLEEELFGEEELEEELEEGAEGVETEVVPRNTQLVELEAGANLSSLVKALNSVGTSPKELIAILQALKASGALTAELEVI